MDSVLDRQVGDSGPARRIFRSANLETNDEAAETRADAASLVVVVPVRNQPVELERCLRALHRAWAAPDEIVVVDDASTDDTVAVARTLGARVVRRSVCGGPAAARNSGIHATAGEIVVFVDADVVVAPDVVAKVRASFARNPDLAAVFGAYDDRPAADGVVSRYRNLLHSYVHQRARREASTFWTGCGAVRRRAIEDAGAFDEARWLNYVEDIEFGGRLIRAGYRIDADPTLRCKHLKRWTLRGMARTDLWHRALPWSRLMLADGGLLDDLNVARDQRVCVILTALVALGLLVAPWQPWGLGLVLAAVLGVLALNAGLFRFLRSCGGIGFAAACLPLHFVHYGCAGLGYGIARAERLFDRVPASVEASMLRRQRARPGPG